MPEQVWAVNTLGGFAAVPYLTEQVRQRAQPKFKIRQFIDVKEAVGRGRGDTFNFDKISNVATQGGTLVETSTIPETNFTINQGEATITEWGNSVPYTSKVNTLGQFEISAQAETALVNDQVKVLESAAGDEFVLTDFTAVCEGTSSVATTTNGTATATASADLTAANTRSIVDFMKRNLVPEYDGENYICIGSVNLFSGMHADTAAGGWQDISKYTESRVSNVFNGVVGRFYKTIFVEETGYFSDTIGDGSTHGSGVFFGADAVYEATSVAEEIRVKVSTDYGRDQGLAWYALLGFQIVWDFANDSEQHIVHVTSA